MALQGCVLHFQKNDLLLNDLSSLTSGRRCAGLRSRKQCDRCWHYLVQDKRYRLCRVDDEGEAIVGFVDASKRYVISFPLVVQMLMGAFILGVVYCL